jgi:hypothetical protein
MTATNYSEPLLAAQRALKRASELAAERRYEEAIGNIHVARMYAGKAERILQLVADAERDGDRLQATAGTDG